MAPHILIALDCPSQDDGPALPAEAIPTWVGDGADSPAAREILASEGVRWIAALLPSLPLTTQGNTPVRTTYLSVKAAILENGSLRVEGAQWKGHCLDCTSQLCKLHFNTPLEGDAIQRDLPSRLSEFVDRLSKRLEDAASG